MIRTLPLMLAAALFVAGCKTSPAPSANVPADHTVDLNGSKHKPGMMEPEKNCAACHGAALDGGAASSCFKCHGKEW